jgi:hypothetical protein
MNALPLEHSVEPKQAIEGREGRNDRGDYVECVEEPPRRRCCEEDIR